MDRYSYYRAWDTLGGAPITANSTFVQPAWGSSLKVNKWFAHQFFYYISNAPILPRSSWPVPGHLVLPMRIYHVICHLALLFSPLLTTSTWRTWRSALPPTWPSLTTRIALSASIVAYPSQFSEAFDEQAHAEQSCEHNWCWVSVLLASVFSKLSEFQNSSSKLRTTEVWWVCFVVIFRDLFHCFRVWERISFDYCVSGDGGFRLFLCVKP